MSIVIRPDEAPLGRPGDTLMHLAGTRKMKHPTPGVYMAVVSEPVTKCGRSTIGMLGTGVDPRSHWQPPWPTLDFDDGHREYCAACYPDMTDDERRIWVDPDAYARLAGRDAD